MELHKDLQHVYAKLKNHADKLVALKCWKTHFGMNWGDGEKMPSLPCIISHPILWVRSARRVKGIHSWRSSSHVPKVWNQLAKCTQPQRNLRASLLRLGGLSAANGFWPPLPAWCFERISFGSMTLRVCWLVLVCLCLDVCTEAGLRLSKATCLVGNLNQHVTERDNFHNRLLKNAYGFSCQLPGEGYVVTTWNI